MSRTTSRRAGYVLVLTLGLLALATISLAGFARYSLSCASSAKDAADELQRRWGLYSVRRELFERAAQIIDSQVVPGQENAPPWPKPSHRSTSFQLGKHEFSITLADEDAKVNVNAIYARQTERTIPTIRRLSQAARANDLVVRLAPQRGTGKPFGSWGQVFDLTRALSPNGGVADRLTRLSDNLTCWGSGRLNLRRASDEAVREIASLALPANKVGELLELRQHWSGQSVEELLRQLDLRRPQLQASGRLVDCESRHYSMWVTLNNGQRSSSYFYVTDGNGPVLFTW
jgi:hypothetical protein